MLKREVVRVRFIPAHRDIPSLDESVHLFWNTHYVMIVVLDGESVWSPDYLCQFVVHIVRIGNLFNTESVLTRQFCKAFGANHIFVFTLLY